MNLAYLITFALLGCVASRPVIGGLLCPNNSTAGQLLCFRYVTLLSAQYVISVKPAGSEAT